MMGIEIPDGDAVEAVLGAGMKRGDGNVVEVAEPHGCVSGGVMPGRAHEGDDGFGGVGDSGIGGGDGGAGGAVGVLVDIIKPRGVRVEVPWLSKTVQVRGGVGERGGGRGGRGGLKPLPVGVLLAQKRGGFEQPRGLFRPEGGAVCGATRVVDDKHSVKVT